MTEKEITFAEHQRRASRAFWDKMTPAERSAWARRAVKARWKKAKAKKEKKK